MTQVTTEKKRRRGRPPAIKFPEGKDSKDFLCDCTDDCRKQWTSDRSAQERQEVLARLIKRMEKDLGYIFPIRVGWRCDKRMSETQNYEDCRFHEGEAVTLDNNAGVDAITIRRVLDRIIVEESLPRMNVFFSPYKVTVAYR